MSPFDLTDKHIVISGASSGIGRQCAISCAQMGAILSLMGRDTQRLNETMDLLPKKCNATVYVGDLTNEVWVKEVVATMVKTTGVIQGLLNCAGISSTQLMKSVGKESLEEMFDNNVYSAFFLTREVTRFKHFSNNGGSIVFFSSVMGSLGETGKMLYSMTKGALQSGTRSLACELAPKRIRVNSVSPGVIITPINENLPHIADPERRMLLDNKHLLGLGGTEDVANACVYLLSDASRWVTGTNLVVDGGYSAR